MFIVVSAAPFEGGYYSVVVLFSGITIVSLCLVVVRSSSREDCTLIVAFPGSLRL